MYIKKLKEKIFSKTYMLVLLIAAGIALLVISELTSGTAKNVKAGVFNESDYGFFLEQKLSGIIEEVTGKDTVEVMITFESTYEALENKDDYSQVFSQYEETEKIIEKPLPKIAGVIIVCKNISNESDFIHIKKAASTVLNISPHKIYIIGGVQEYEKNI